MPDRRQLKNPSPFVRKGKDGGANHEDMQSYLFFDKTSCFGIKEFLGFRITNLILQHGWGCSSVGRAYDWQS